MLRLFPARKLDPQVSEPVREMDDSPALDSASESQAYGHIAIVLHFWKEREQTRIYGIHRDPTKIVHVKRCTRSQLNLS